MLALKTTGLVKRYPDVVAVDGLDLEVPRGECFGLLGPNGAGKTTTVEILEGLTEPDQGLVEVLGLRWGSGHDQQLRERIGVQLQETRLTERLTVEETLRLFRSFYPRGREVEQVIEQLELGEKRRAQVGKLSGGQRQRLALGCALAGEPEVLFLDEPTTGLDPQARHKIWDLVRDFKTRGGTICLTTHYMEEASTLCDRVAIVDHGKMICLGSPAELIAGLGAHTIVELEVDRELLPFEGLPGVTKLERVEGRYQLSLSDAGSSLTAVLAELERRGLSLRSLTTHHPTLEDVFLSATGRHLRDDS